MPYPKDIKYLPLNVVKRDDLLIIDKGRSLYEIRDTMLFPVEFDLTNFRVLNNREEFSETVNIIKNYVLDITQICGIEVNPESIMVEEIPMEIETDDFSEEIIECIICMRDKKNVELSCKHAYCLCCVRELSKLKKTCPMCETHISGFIFI